MHSVCVDYTQLIPDPSNELLPQVITTILAPTVDIEAAFLHLLGNTCDPTPKMGGANTTFAQAKMENGFNDGREALSEIGSAAAASVYSQTGSLHPLLRGDHRSQS